MTRMTGPDCVVMCNLINTYIHTYIHTYILPQSHKSGALCLYEPLPVSDALGDDFFEIFDVFLVETFFFFSKPITLHGPTAAKKSRPPKGHILLPFRGK